MFKILTKKKQEEILRRLAENDVLYYKEARGIEEQEKFIENEVEIALAVGGYDGIIKVMELRQDLRKNAERECDGK